MKIYIKRMSCAVLTFSLLLMSSQVFSEPLVVKGRVVSLDIQKQEYVIENAETGELHVFHFKDTTSIRINNRRQRNLSKLPVGGSVIYKQTVKPDHIDTSAKQGETKSMNDNNLGQLHKHSNKDLAKVKTQEPKVIKLPEGQKIILEVVTR